MLLLLIAVVLVNYTPVQNYMAHRAANMLTKKLKTKVRIEHIRIDFLNHLLVQGLFVEDQAYDTLLYAGEAQVRITDWFIFKDKPVLQYLALDNAYVHLYRTAVSKDWNYKFIEDAFSTGKKKDNSKSKPFEFDLQKVELVNTRFHMDDPWGGEDMGFDIGTMAINARDVDFTKKILDIKAIEGTNTTISIKDYEGGKPHVAHTGALVIDTTPFNTGKWAVLIRKLSFVDFAFNLTTSDKIPLPEVFDETHLAVKKINLLATGINIAGDTLHGNMDNLSCRDRCGLTIKQMRAKVTVSPVASICENLYLETGYSKLQNYYAMHYKRFPDFNNYIDSVVMVARLKDAFIDDRDIAFFSPDLRKFKVVSVHVSGEAKGTVANLAAHHLHLTDGITTIKGNLAMKGLPDIYTTDIAFKGELATTGAGIFRYAPALRNSPNVAFEKVTALTFNGDYTGRIENFAVVGTLATNLGSLTTNMQMNIPGFNGRSAVYTGTLAANNLQLGTFVKQPVLGTITFKEEISGRSFDLETAQMKLDGTIKEFGINNYLYHNIITRGTLAKKEFIGSLLVDDPNLALEFDGGINYGGKNVNIKATAHLLGSNFKALNLTTDTITASADFDLNCTGSNIDNFSGYAKLFNLDLKRFGHRLAIDSVYIRSTGEGAEKQLTVQSNNLEGSIKGNYLLSQLPASIQYYLSRYIPNYIKAPANFVPVQNLEFAIKTRDIDSILAVTIPFVRGFDSSTFTGSLNTMAQKLALNVNVPAGSVGSVHMNNIAINGLGNLNLIGLNTTIDNVTIGDSLMNGSLSLTSTISKDMVTFTVATTSPDSSSAITLNGQILARKDSLFLNLMPSQFYLNQMKWDISGGSKVVYSDKYLLVQGLTLSSGLQKITAATELQSSTRALIINTENLDLGQFGSWGGLSSYQPDGRLSGTIKIDRIFQDLYIRANMKATDVKLGTEAIGNIVIIGNYNGGQKLISLDPQTGVYRDGASVTAAGNMSFDTATHQKLDGHISFNNTPVSWATPFVNSIMSRLTGTINGNVDFTGTSFKPVIKGALKLDNAGMRIDFLGCYYSIPSANVTIDNKRITFLGTVPMYDVFKNTATLTGYFSHNLFADMRVHLTMRTNKFEVMNLTANDNNLFYGNLIASMDSFTVRGLFSDIRLRAYKAMPAAKSRVYIPVSYGSEGNTYNYVTFKTYGTNQEKVVRKRKDKLHINIEATLNQLAEMHIVLDPSTGDEIMARGYGNLQMDIPPGNDVTLNGLYTIDNGYYKFTFKQLPISRQFQLNEGSAISFNGPFSETSLDVDAVYSTKAKLSDLLNDAEKSLLSQNDLLDAQKAQQVNIMLHMSGSLMKPTLTYNLDLEDKHSQGSLAYRKMQLLNFDERLKNEQVAAILLVGNFIATDGSSKGAVASGAINNFSQLLSSTASTGLTALVNKITGDKNLFVDVKYTTYGDGGNLTQKGTIDVKKNFYNDRIIVEAGPTTYFGGRSASASNSGFNVTGDFRVQYLISPHGNLRLNAFSSSDYDVTLDKNIQRNGAGISWRKSFDNVNEFFRSNNYMAKKKAQQEALLPPDSVKGK